MLKIGLFYEKLAVVEMKHKVKTVKEVIFLNFARGQVFMDGSIYIELTLEKAELFGLASFWLPFLWPYFF